MIGFARWDTRQAVWLLLDGTIDLFSEHSELFLETWPTSGMTLGGVAYEQPTWAPRMGGIGSSSLQDLLPTPVAQPSGNSPENHLRKKPGREVVTDLAILVENGLLESGGKLLPTPRASEGDKGGPNQRGSKGDATLSGLVTLLPTPSAADGVGGRHNSEGHQITLPGVVRELATSLLPTPVTSDSRGVGIHGVGGQDLRTAISELLPTPNAALASKGGVQSPEKRRAGGHTVGLDDAVSALLPTPKAGDAVFVSPSTSGRPVERSTHLTTQALLIAGELEHRRTLLPTVTTSNVSGNDRNNAGRLNLPGVAKERSVNWGQYAPAIERWEQVLGIPAPAPTRPDGKNGNARLSPLLTEWMMGLEPGWVTDPEIWVGVSASAARAAQIKACGNGVVPQQAAAAVDWLLEGWL